MYIVLLCCQLTSSERNASRKIDFLRTRIGHDAAKEWYSKSGGYLQFLTGSNTHIGHSKMMSVGIKICSVRHGTHRSGLIKPSQFEGHVNLNV